MNEKTCPDCGKSNVELEQLETLRMTIRCPDCDWFICITTMMLGGLHISTKAHPMGAEYY